MELSHETENHPKKEIRLNEPFYPFDTDVEVSHNRTRHYPKELKQFRGYRMLVLKLDNEEVKGRVDVDASAYLQNHLVFAPYDLKQTYRVDKKDFNLKERGGKAVAIEAAHGMLPNLSNPLIIEVFLTIPEEDKKKMSNVVGVIRKLYCGINFEELGQHYAGLFWRERVSLPFRCDFFFPADTGPLASGRLPITPTRGISALNIDPGNPIYLPSDLEKLEKIAVTIDFAPKSWVNKQL